MARQNDVCLLGPLTYWCSTTLNYKPVAFLVLFAVPLCFSAHSPAILWPLGSTVRTEQEYVCHITIGQPRKPEPGGESALQYPGSAGNSIMASEVRMDSAEIVRFKTNSTTFKNKLFSKAVASVVWIVTFMTGWNLFSQDYDWSARSRYSHFELKTAPWVSMIGLKARRIGETWKFCTSPEAQLRLNMSVR